MFFASARLGEKTDKKRKMNRERELSGGGSFSFLLLLTFASLVLLVVVAFLHCILIFKSSCFYRSCVYNIKKTNEKILKTLSFNDNDKIKDKVNSTRFDFLV